MSETATPELITVRTEGRAGIITLNRPKQLNALNDQLMTELGAALQAFDGDEAIGCMIITGSEKAFAAGADIGAMATYTFADVYKGDYITRNWETIRQIRKPVIAAVSGFALGGGCELAMMCDFIIASKTAKFGQPEITLGIIPGMGGSQRHQVCVFTILRLPCIGGHQAMRRCQHGLVCVTKDRHIGHGKRTDGFSVVTTLQTHELFFITQALVAPAVKTHLQRNFHC